MWQRSCRYFGDAQLDNGTVGSVLDSLQLARKAGRTNYWRLVCEFLVHIDASNIRPIISSWSSNVHLGRELVVGAEGAEFCLRMMTRGMSRGADAKNDLGEWSLENRLTFLHTNTGGHARWDGTPKATARCLALNHLVRRDDKSMWHFVVKERIRYSRRPIRPRFWWRRCVKALLHLHLHVFGHSYSEIKSVLSLVVNVFAQARDSVKNSDVEEVKLLGRVTCL